MYLGQTRDPLQLVESHILLVCMAAAVLAVVQQVASPICCRCCQQVPADYPVAIYGEGKEHAMAVGITKMSTADMKAINKGIGVDNLHYLNDGLWKHIDLEH